MRPDSRTHLVDNSLFVFLLFLFYFSSGDIAFYEHDVPLPLTLFMESTLYVFLLGGVFYLVVMDWIGIQYFKLQHMLLIVSFCFDFVYFAFFPRLFVESSFDMHVSRQPHAVR